MVGHDFFTFFLGGDDEYQASDSKFIGEAGKDEERYK